MYDLKTNYYTRQVPYFDLCHMLSRPRMYISFFETFWWLFKEIKILSFQKNKMICFVPSSKDWIVLGKVIHVQDQLNLDHNIEHMLSAYNVQTQTVEASRDVYIKFGVPFASAYHTPGIFSNYMIPCITPRWFHNGFLFRQFLC